MAVSEQSGLTRRTVLTGAALLAAGAAMPRLAHAATAAPRIRAAAAGWAGQAGELLVLTVDPRTDDDYAIRILTAEAAEAAEAAPATGPAPAALGPALPLELPAGFHPHSMAALGASLWITGAVEAAPNLARPGLVRILNGRAAYVDLPVPEAIRSGVATAVLPLGERGLAVVIEGCPDPHLALITRSHLALTSDAGRTWTGQPLAAGLGEAYGTVLTDTGNGLFAVVGAGDGTQTVYIRQNSTASLSPGPSFPGAGRPMAAVATAQHVSVFSDQQGTVTEARYTPSGAALETNATTADCACTGEILAVPGRRGLWLETDVDTVHIRGAR